MLAVILSTKGYPRQQKSRSQQADLVFPVDLAYLFWDSFNQMNEMDQRNQTNQFYVGGLFGKGGSD